MFTKGNVLPEELLDGQTATLYGKVREEVFAGPPNYESVNDGDKPEFYEKTVMTALLLIPVFFLIVGIVASLYLLIRHYRRRRALLNRRRHRVHKK